jgi:hypothetical protein
MPLITIGELIDRSWDHYRKEFADLISISGWILVTAVINIVALALYPNATKLATGAALTSAESVGVGLFAFSNWLLAPALGLFIFIALVRLVRSQLSGRRGSVREAFLDGQRLFLPTLLVSALIALILLAVLVISFGPSALLAFLSEALGSSALSLVASLLLVVGVIIGLILSFRWSIHYYFAPYTLLIDDVHGRATLPASSKLVGGRYWSVLLRLLVPKLVFVLIGVLGMAVLTFVFSIATSAMTGLNLDVQLRLSTIATSVLSTIVAALLNPLVVIADVMLYQSLKR